MNASRRDMSSRNDIPAITPPRWASAFPPVLVLVTAVVGSALSEWWGRQVGDLTGHRSMADGLVAFVLVAVPAVVIVLSCRWAKGGKMVARSAGAAFVWALAAQPFGARYFMPVFSDSRPHLPGYLVGLACGAAVALLVLLLGWQGFMKPAPVDAT